jgi:hypothetical protein
MYSMPILPVNEMAADYNEFDAAVIRAAFTGRGVKEGLKLRTNKPFNKVSSYLEGCANYVWRMLCFDLVGHGKHVCMPVTADWEVSTAFDVRDGCVDWKDDERRTARREDVRNTMKELDELVKRFESVLPIEAQKGIIRWGSALGMC